MGKFYLTEKDELEARDIKLAAALNIQLQDGGWRRVTVAQAVTMLVEINGKTEDKEGRAEDSRRYRC